MSGLPSPDWSPVIEGLAQSRYAVIKNVLPAELATALRAELVALRADGRFYPAGIGRGQRTGVHEDIRGDVMCWLEPDMPAAQCYLAVMEELRERLNQEFFLCLCEFEAHYAHYAPGSFYRRHVDRHRDSDARVISTVFYLNPDWPATAGGELNLFDASEQLLLRLSPDFNTLVVFMSDAMPHEVCAANRERQSIAGWFRIRV